MTDSSSWRHASNNQVSKFNIKPITAYSTNDLNIKEGAQGKKEVLWGKILLRGWCSGGASWAPFRDCKVISLQGLVLIFISDQE